MEVQQQDDTKRLFLDASGWIIHQLEQYHFVFDMLEELEGHADMFLHQRRYSMEMHRKAVRTFLALSPFDSAKSRLQSVAEFLSEVDRFYANVSHICSDYFAHSNTFRLDLSKSHEASLSGTLFTKRLLHASLATLAEKRAARPFLNGESILRLNGSTTYLSLPKTEDYIFLHCLLFIQIILCIQLILYFQWYPRLGMN